MFRDKFVGFEQVSEILAELLRKVPLQPDPRRNMLNTLRDFESVSAVMCAESWYQQSKADCFLSFLPLQVALLHFRKLLCHLLHHGKGDLWRLYVSVPS